MRGTPSVGVRNVFDQYSVPENRLSHALASCLSEDRRLLRSFLRKVAGVEPPDDVPLGVCSQRLPGESEAVEEDAERRGLPDICIHDPEDWAIAVESKVESALQDEQLHRHRRTLLRRGFQEVRVLALTAEGQSRGRSSQFLHATWGDVYEWSLRESRRSEWAARLARYLEVAEARMVEEGYLKTASLTRFSGFQFGPDQPYTYQEAKRVLRLAMEELRRRRDLSSRLGTDGSRPGRTAITGRGQSGVWNFIPLKAARGANNFTEFPHLTLSVGSERILAIVTVPNGIRREFRQRLLAGGWEGFQQLSARIGMSFARKFKNVPGAIPVLEATQRHYPTQRSAPINDVRTLLDLRTAISRTAGLPNRASVKYQPEWLEGVYRAIARRRSNIQLAFGGIFPYERCPAVGTRRSLDFIASTWLACKPLIDVLLGKGD